MPSTVTDAAEPTSSSGPVAATRDRILDAARELILQQHAAALTVAEIAKAAGVSHRTVYRYFPTKEELILAVAERPTEGLPAFMEPTRWDEARGALRVQWQWFGERLDVLRSERMVPGGLELRQARLERGRPAFDRLLEDAGVQDGPGRASLVELVIHLTSSTTLLEFVDRHGMTVEQATDTALDAVERLVQSVIDDQ